MKSCVLCGTEREDISAVQVLPAGWNSFNNFAEVCAECQASPRFITWAKAAASKARRPTVGTAVAPRTSVTDRSPVMPPNVQITHRQTGALLHATESQTLAGASLSGVALGNADLRHAALRGADMHRADLHLADLGGADLRGADLRGVNFRGADLRGADLREARLQRADISHCLYDASTRWPSDFDPQPSGGVKEIRRG